MAKKVILLLIPILLISFCLAENHQVNTQFDFKVPCINSSGFKCSDLVNGQLTISYPNSTTLLQNTTMTNLKNGIFNYTFSGDNLSLLGEYNYIVFFSDGISISGSFFITQTGYSQTVPEALGTSIYLILMICLTVLFGYIGFRLSESEYLWVLGIFFIFMALLFVVYDAYLGFEYYINYTGANNTNKMPEIIFFMLLSFITLGLFTTIVMLIKNWKKLQKEVKRGLEEKEDDDDFT